MGTTSFRWVLTAHDTQCEIASMAKMILRTLRYKCHYPDPWPKPLRCAGVIFQIEEATICYHETLNIEFRFTYVPLGKRQATGTITGARVQRHSP